MNCGMGIIVTQSDDGKIRFCGPGFNTETSPAECPKCHRLFPLARPKVDGKPWIEFSCNRTEEHEKNGKHWYQNESFRLEWEVDAHGGWLANANTSENSHE